MSTALDTITHLRNRNLWDLASALNGALQGTAWTASRRHPSDADLQTCPRCHCAPETPWHRYWDCPHNSQITDDHKYIQNSQFLRDVFTRNPELYPECFWARAIVPHRLSGADIPPNDVDILTGTDLNTLVRDNSHVVIYSDGAGFPQYAHLAAQFVGGGAFVTGLLDCQWSPQFACLATSIPKEQTVPRAELHTPTRALQRVPEAHHALIVTDAEDFFLTATTQQRLDKALQGVNADLWLAWLTTIQQHRGAITLLHVRSHALDKDNPKAPELLEINRTRRRYAAPAGRDPLTQERDATSLAFYRDHHAHPWHSLGNFYADALAAIAQRKAAPLPSVVDQFIRHASYAVIAARRIATIEAFCRSTAAHEQALLMPPPPPPPPSDTFLQVSSDLTSSGHSIYRDTKGWIRCRYCQRRAKANPLRTFALSKCPGRPLEADDQFAQPPRKAPRGHLAPHLPSATPDDLADESAPQGSSGSTATGPEEAPANTISAHIIHEKPIPEHTPCSGMGFFEISGLKENRIRKKEPITIQSCSTVPLKVADYACHFNRNLYQ